MEVERKRSKGGFFHLFDWNGKSRKKLFSNNSESSEESKLGKPAENLVKSLPDTEGDEYTATSSNRRSSDFNSASSVTSDEGYGSRAPGVVARLMGLDSLPTLNVSEPSSTQYSGSCSLRVSHYERSTPTLWNEYHEPTDHSNISNKLHRLSSNPIEPKFHKVQNRPIERFQTEILPPKSAKSIPITHHKLLSPIRSPGFRPTKNAAYIMEAAAKIIEASPQTTYKHKGPSFGSSLVPLKIRDLKEKIEAAHKVSRPQRPNEPSVSVAKPLKGQPKDKSHNKVDYTPTFRISQDSEKGSSNNSRIKGKSVSLSEQARVNVQSKKGLSLSGNGSSTNQKERNDVRRKQFSRTKADMQTTVDKGTSANRTNNVLRQNNQKQNCISNRDYSTSKTSTLDQQGRKARSVNGTIGLNRAMNKVTVNSEPQSRKTGSVATDTAKELPMSRRKNLPRKKQPVNEDRLSGETRSDNSSINGSERSIKCNITTDGYSNQESEKMKTSMDVVSFTFTSPIKRSLPDIPSTGQVVEKSSFDSDPSGDNDLLFLKSSASSSSGVNIIGGDALSVLLEKRLQELTCRVESSNCNIIIEGASVSPTSSLQNSVPSSGIVTATSVRHCKRLQMDLDKDISYSSGDFDRPSIDNLGLDGERRWQHSEQNDEQNASSSCSETGTELDLRHSSPFSTLETAFTSESCSDSINDLKQFLFAEDQQVLSSIPGNESLTEFYVELSDSASSKPMGETSKKLLIRTSSFTDFKESINWELDYVKMVLKDSQLTCIEYALGQTEKFMTLNSSNQLEHHNGTERNGEDYNKLEQKILLDCVTECLESRCGQVFVGRCKGWVKWRKMIQKREWLAEEVYKEILGWKTMGDIMVDDLVDKDMNTKCGRWLDFDQEAFEEGVEVENSILTSLVDELVCDLLL
ncbi:hypothetical protein PTKIN_Ptkin06aG0216400 [Pterospermum kingtungense]